MLENLPLGRYLSISIPPYSPKPEEFGIANGVLVFPNRLVVGDVLIHNQRISALGPNATPNARAKLEVNSLFIAPGFLVLQANGALGYSFMTASPGDYHRFELFRAARDHWSFGHARLSSLSGLSCCPKAAAGYHP